MSAMSESTTAEAPTTEEVNTSTPEPSGEVTKTLADEIDAGVDAVMAEIKGEEETQEEQHTEEVADDEEEAQQQADPVAQDKEPDPEPEAKVSGFDALPDALVERAVKAGLPLSEIKQYPSEALLNAMCARIEGVAGDGSPKDAQSGDEGQETGVETILAQIPDLDPDEYDEPLVAGFKNLKEIVRQFEAKNESLRTTIEEMRGNQSKGWFDKKLDGVKKFTKNDAAKSASVRETFDVLKAGYKATGKDVSDDTIFDKAAEMVLGDDMRAAKRAKKTDAARNRNGQFISRVSSNNVQGKPGNIDAEIAAEIDKAFPSS